MARLIGGVFLLLVVSFLAFTDPGRDLHRGVVDWATERAEEWTNDQIEEMQERRQQQIGTCGNDVAPQGTEVSEAEAIRSAVRFWGEKNLRCERTKAELVTAGPRPRWSVAISKRRGCQLSAVVDAISGKALEGGGGCP